MTDSVPADLRAVVVARDRETRTLLRGLLRLHRVQVIGEADGEARAVEVIRDSRPTIVVIDAILGDGSWTAVISEAGRVVPEVRSILLVPATRPNPPAPSPSGPTVVLLRPFRIREFAKAIPTPGSGS